MTFNEAGFILKECYKYFPKGTIHLVSINDVLTEAHDHIIMEYDGHYFIGSDNGVFSIVCGKEPSVFYSLNIALNSNVMTFPLRDIGL